ncbi:MAG: PAS domain-containing protein [Limisphaerales bacterium]
MGQLSERKDLLRILLADDDDANAFVFQCGINRLSRPCAFQRVGAHTLLPDKFNSFRPDILIAAGHFAQPAALKQIKQLTNGHPVICIVDSAAEAETCLDLGAADCVLQSQREQLAACLERHLDGANTPSFQRSKEKNPIAIAKKSEPGHLELKLEDIDRRIGAFLRQFAKQAKSRWLELVRVSRMGWSSAEREAKCQFGKLKAQWLLRKQKGLVHSPHDPCSSEFGDLGDPLSRFESQTAPTLELKSRKVYAMPAPAESREYRDEQMSCKTPLGAEPLKPQPVPPIESVDSDTLRTLELSFKTLFHTGLDAMFLMDGLGCFLHTNAPGCALLGLTPADLLGKSLLDFVPTDQKAQASALWEALLIEGRQKAEILLQSASGEKRDVLLSARSNLWFGVHLLVVRDQTELKALRNASCSSGAPMNAS